MDVCAEKTVTAGAPFPLGATLTSTGVNFSVHADGDFADDGSSPVSLCLMDEGGHERRIPLRERSQGVWHVFVPGVRAGQRYGYRSTVVDPAKLLLDPYARAVTTTDYDLTAASTIGADTAGIVPAGIVTAPVSARSATPCVPWEHTVIYEGHVKGMTAQHPLIPREIRGTYAGLAHPAFIDHLVSLGITALELLPVHAHADEPLLRRLGRPNYWGYSTLSFFALHPGYASQPGAEREEFAAAVDALHAAGIEVLLDVVFNHTCEGGRQDPIWLSLRGLAPSMYLPATRDLTGTGNTLDAHHLATVRLVTDSLRYFAKTFQVDGFRFDLAPVLGRPSGSLFDPRSGLLTAIVADPLLRDRKLIAEPWDATGDGYSLGRFGPDWAEWNDEFRDTARDYWRGAAGVRELAYRLAGSEDLFAGRQPWASINLVTAHDGFTLRDLVSYQEKHNEANGQHNTDGSDNNRSSNYGLEGDGDPDTPLPDEILQLRARQARNLAATLLLATGTPMISAGDELWRTQRGNNNAYSTDGPLTWIDWSATDVMSSGPATTLDSGPTTRGAQDRPGVGVPAQSDAGVPAAAHPVPDSRHHQVAADMLAFFRHVLAIRAAAPALHQGSFFSGRTPHGGEGAPDLGWFDADGTAMTHDDWFAHERRTVLVWFDGREVYSHGPRGRAVSDDSWMLLLHANPEPATVTLPGLPYGDEYLPVIDTDSPTGMPADTAPLSCGVPVTVPGRTVWLLRARERGAERGRT